MGVGIWVRRLGLASATVAVVVMVTACRRQTDTAQDARSGLIGVTVQAARLDTLRDVVTAPGTVVPAAAADWVIYAPDNGEVIELPVKEEDAVTPGAVLVKFQIASAAQEMAALQLDVLQATNKYDQAKSDLNKKQALYDQGLLARVAFDASRLEVSQAESLLTQAQTRIDLAKTVMDRSTIRARFPGKVVKVWHAVGDMVRGGETDPVIRLIDPARVQVAVQIPIAQLARITPGQAAIVRAIAGAADEPAAVTGKADSTDPTAATGEIRLTFTTPATQLVDTPVSVEIVLDQRVGAIIVPAASVKRDPQGSYLMMAGDDGHAHRRDVHVGLVTKDLTQITGGLSAGERVIVAGLDDVTDGAAIVISQ